MTSGALALNTGNGHSLRLGRWGDQYYFDGALDDVALYSVALTWAEVYEIYNPSFFRGVRTIHDFSSTGFFL